MVRLMMTPFFTSMSRTRCLTNTRAGSFYILAAVKLSYGDLEGTRKTLRDISEKDYWHTTDELRTSEGQYRTVEMLKQLDSWGDKHLVSVELPLQSGEPLSRLGEIA
ncbi:hypothetical protein CDHC01_0148 [Corynebacterium diphtheriae HC01]|nr:hypothetical protein CD241_0147 [Corynebacterium diphtheriae 241]AEX73401.1 hypothetical protein CDHC01_0148 [Corynebacterium diphtheriae HC01]